MKWHRIIWKNLKEALSIPPDKVKMEDGMSEEVARKHREFSRLTEKEQRARILRDD